MVRITIIHFHRRCTLSKYLSSTVKSRIYALTYKNKFLRARHVKYSPNTRIHGRAIFFICSSLVDIVGIHRQRSLRYRGAAFRRANTRRFGIALNGKWRRSPVRISPISNVFSSRVRQEIKVHEWRVVRTTSVNQPSSLFHRGVPSISFVAGDNAPRQWS